MEPIRQTELEDFLTVELLLNGLRDHLIGRLKSGAEVKPGKWRAVYVSGALYILPRAALRNAALRREVMRQEREREAIRRKPKRTASS
jgi:hypothetical protein